MSWSLHYLTSIKGLNMSVNVSYGGLACISGAFGISRHSRRLHPLLMQWTTKTGSISLCATNSYFTMIKKQRNKYPTALSVEKPIKGREGRSHRLGLAARRP